MVLPAALQYLVLVGGGSDRHCIPLRGSAKETLVILPLQALILFFYAHKDHLRKDDANFLFHSAVVVAAHRGRGR